MILPGGYTPGSAGGSAGPRFQVTTPTEEQVIAAVGAEINGDYLAYTEQPTAVPSGVNLGEIVVWLRDNLPDDAFMCNGAVQFARAGDRHNRRQRPLRHHSHAPGARISRPRLPHRSAQSRFRRLCEGVRGLRVKVEKTADFADAFRAAEQSGLPAIIHLKVDPDATTPATTLTKIREAALARQH
jgi:thiamine pyrophosphate-dependent acetolactate synthase large subunit-like protein